MKWQGKRIHKANPVNVSNIVNSVVKNIGFGPDIRLEKLKKMWNNIVGEVNAKNTRPIAIKNEKLTVAVSSPAWIIQTRFLKSSFIEKINKFDPQDSVNIHDINFIIDSSG